MPPRRATGHGDARKGAGRKRDLLPPEIRDRIGTPPTDKPLKLARWYSSALSEFLWLYLTTGKYVEMLRETKGAAGAMGRVMPLDLQFEAAKLIKNDEDDLAEDEDPDEEVREPVSAIKQSVEMLLEAESADNRRHVDMAVSLRLCDVDQDENGRAWWRTETDEELIEIGGRWDRREKRWSGEARRVRVIRVHRGQEEPARWLAEWFARGPGAKGQALGHAHEARAVSRIPARVVALAARRAARRQVSPVVCRPRDVRRGDAASSRLGDLADAGGNRRARARHVLASTVRVSAESPHPG